MLRDTILHEIIVNLEEDLVHNKLDVTFDLYPLLLENLNNFTEKNINAIKLYNI